MLRNANTTDLPAIWEIIQYAIEQRRKDGSDQWQDGYPNETTIQNDLDNGNGYVLEEDGIIQLYAAIIFEKEPAYENIQGKWLTNNDYIVLHRIAASPIAKGKGTAVKLLQLTEELCIKKNIYSIKIDTNFDNLPMLKILDKMGYTYCGEVFFRGSPRKAFEKVLKKNS